MKRVFWINPTIDRGNVRWPSCEAEISTEEARMYRQRNGQPIACELRAKVSYDGKLLCVRHAQGHALAELIGETSPETGEGSR